MSVVKVWLTQAQQMWRNWTLTQRISIVGAALASLAAVCAVGLWSMQSQYVPLAADLSPTTAAELVSTLEAAGISTRLNFSGSSVMVPKQDLSRARLASGKILDLTASPADDLEGSVWSDPTLHHVRLLRQQEQRLARSISQFDFVRSATVHLSVPEPSPFIRDQAAPTASVVVALRAAHQMNRQDGAAIVALVAHSVEGLDPAKVTVMDTHGQILSASEPIEGNVAGQLEYRRRMESDLAAKAETLLSQMLGVGKAAVRVTADIDFTETQRETTSYDPEKKVKVTETTKSESHTGNSPARSSAASVSGAGGATGATANSAPPSTSTSGLTKIEENTTEYANGETKDKVHEAPGKLRRMTVAAVVQLPDAPADGSPALLTVDGVKSLIQQAVGFDELRGDQIQVVSAPLVGAIPVTPEAVPVPWSQYEQLVRSASLGLAAIVALLLGWLVLRRFRPTVSITSSAEPAEASDRLATLSMRARENPEAVAQALSAWMSTARSSESPAEAPARRAA